ncbi:MAG: Xylose isomerase-like TIM barrel [Spirochaetes bacterium ADurb.Bin110]|nr:MAG: Xylose isomerase-like TIM barrel [Spirochaetes bacterium ADurb.Bin110]
MNGKATMNLRWAKRIAHLSEIEQAKEQGFQIVQLPVTEIMRLDDHTFIDIKEHLLKTGLSLEVFESPLPKGVNTTERGFNIYAWIEYLKKAIGRISELGCKTLVWGDGQARILPQEGEATVLKENFNQFLFMVAEITDKKDIVFCLEPLGPKKTNFLNSLEEVVGVLGSVGKKNLAITIASSDIIETNMRTEDVLHYRDLIAHAYLDSLEEVAGLNREMATFSRASGTPHRILLLSILKKISYDKVIALPNDADSETLALCKEAWDRV